MISRNVGKDADVADWADHPPPDETGQTETPTL